MKRKKLQCSVPTLLLAGVLCLTLAACGAKQSSDMPASDTDSAVSAALPVKAMNAKRVDENPYMAKSDANIHHDGYNTDSTDEVLPLGIYPEINVSYEKTNANASPAIYFDSYGHAVVPLLGGIAIRDLNAEETTTLGYFSPKQHDGGGYVIQSSYTFMDSENRIVCPTSNNHVLMLRATDEAGNVLPEFEKVLDIDIKAAAEAALGKELTQNLLSVVFDYDGNLWFATGGFRIYPQRQQQGVIGYIARSAIDAILNGEQTDLSKAVFVHELTPGEGAENGIAASKDGAVVLTNQNCYLLRAEEGVDVVWCTPYESAGAKVSGEGDKTTGGGLAWGGGCSPTLTPNLVLFTDNQDTVNLLALDMKTGEVVASTPVLDDLHLDTVVTALYTSYTPALKSIDVRINGRPIFYVDGLFGGSNALSVTSQTPSGVANATEQWLLDFSDDGQETHTIRYLPQGKQGSVYVQQDGKWIKVPTDTFGSYITFTAAGTEIVMAFVPKGIPLWELCGGTVAALLVAAFLARKLIHKRKARKAKKNAAPVEELDTPIESDDQSTEQHTK